MISNNVDLAINSTGLIINQLTEHAAKDTDGILAVNRRVDNITCCV